MLLLPRGVTGFAEAVEGTTVPDLRGFRADCWHVARNLKAKVEDVEMWPPSSFVAQALIWPESAIVVLLNQTVPILGFCEPFKPGTGQFEFIDNEKAAGVFAEFGKYEIWSKNVLDLHIRKEMCDALGPSEKRRWKYFRKGVQKRVGDVVFNHWD